MGYLGGTFTVTAGSTSAFFNGNSLRSGSGGKVTLAGTTLRTVCNMVLKLRGLLMSGSVATAMSIWCVCVLSLRGKCYCGVTHLLSLLPETCGSPKTVSDILIESLNIP